MSNTIPDLKKRELALDITKSFIIQAPAGSGKTELLIQRYLSLLAIAEKTPEEIIAITFTKKAAREMQIRVINALNDAKTNPEPTIQNKAKTYNLAKQVLKKDAQQNWNLLENPNRMAIQTIDSLISKITRAMPIMSNFGAAPNISTDPKILYQKAIDAMISEIDSPIPLSKNLSNLLEHLDNNLELMHYLMREMLAKRDQWLPHIIQNNDEGSLRQFLENNLQNVTESTWNELRKLIDKSIFNELDELLNYSEINKKINDIYYETINYKSCSLPQKKYYWLTKIASMLTTQSNTWRKTINKTNGFPASPTIQDPQQKQLATEMKDRFKQLIESFENNDELLDLLASAKYLPPCEYTDQQWNILYSLFKILPSAVAYLALTFQEHGEVDFPEMALGAFRSLGEPESPSELALALDYKIRHILVDEFQDTSILQFKLLEQLTYGWEQNDGRTLFLVGDPMQSIYRFRNAEVKLFNQAKQNGIGNIFLTQINLTSNFRSSALLVNWFNRVFNSVNEAIAIKQQLDSDKIQIHPLINETEKEEAAHICSILKEHLTLYPDDSVAILVKARNHLIEIIKALKNADINYTAVEIDPLSTKIVVSDLLSLTKAMLYPTDRISWLAILRAPWCGLTLPDLSIIASNQYQTIFSGIENALKNNLLSKDGYKRLSVCYRAISNALKSRSRSTLRDYIYQIWIDLNGPACLFNKTDLDDAGSFFNVLDEAEKYSTYVDIKYIEDSIKNIFSSQKTQNTNIQVMTIHKAKGLEFDTVILPQLHKTSPNQSQQLLLWQVNTNENSLLLAPISTKYHETDKIYQYCLKENNIKDKNEDVRLLYVALTRAKKRIHLLGNVEYQTENQEIANPTIGSFLNLLWPIVKENYLSHTKQIDLNSPTDLISQKKPQLYRLSSNSFLENLHLEQTQKYISQSDLFSISDQIPIAIGTITHNLLALISTDGLKNWPGEKLQSLKPYIQSKLMSIGLSETELSKATKTIYIALKNTLSDPRGQWILYNHNDAKSEFKLTTIENMVSKHYIIDRTFLDDQNNRWVIDYKIATFTSDNLQVFLEKQKLQYQVQLEKYGELLKKLYKEKINFGLYFPLLQAWISWS